MCTKTPASQPIPPPYYKTCRNRSIILMLLDTGIRLSECASLSLSDINLEAGIIRVWGKGGKQRLAKLGRTALEALRVYLELRGCPNNAGPVAGQGRAATGTTYCPERGRSLPASSRSGVPNK